MAAKIKSLAMSGPVLVQLSSGRTVRLSPGQVSDEMPDVEVVDNAKVDKLRRQGLIDIETTDEPAAAVESAAQPQAQGESDRKSRSPSRKQTDPSG